MSTRIVFFSKKMLPSFQKNVLPAHQQNNVVYKYSCDCDGMYVGRISQRQEERIRQHIPKSIKNQVKPQKDLPKGQCKYIQNAPILDSAIGQCLFDNKICEEEFDINWFCILATGRSFFIWQRLKPH